MTVLAAIGYLRILVAGVASMAWRCLLSRPCPCEFCRAHRRFVRESAAAYRAEVSSLSADHGAQRKAAS